MKIETIAIHGSMNEQAATGDVVPPIHPSTIFEHGDAGMTDSEYSYTRLDNPNRRALEQLLASLEGGEACAAFASGVAATASVLQALAPGDHLIAPDDVYHGTRKLITDFMEPWGLEVSFVDLTDTDALEAAIRPETRLVWIESPSNPMLLVTDIPSVSLAVKERDIVVCVDNTWPTPVNQRPLELGADLVVHSTTKYLGGHSDILGGAVIAKRTGGIFERIKELQAMTGAVPAPNDCWLLARSIRTLPYRMRGHNENAQRVAGFLQEHERVSRVHYPGLPTHPGHGVAARQMNDFGGMISFEVEGGAEEALAVVNSSRLIRRATSLGGVESTWEHRRSSEGPASTTPEALIRLSVGLEHIDDLLEDLEQALAITE